MTPTNIQDELWRHKIHVLFVILAFCAMYYLSELLKVPIHQFIEKYTALKSEYTVYEQLSKFYLFIILMVSFCSYLVLNEPIDVKLSISLFLLGTILYMSESNMIIEKAQPLFGLLIIPYTILLLARSRKYVILILFMLAFGFIGVSSLKDILSEHQSIASLAPAISAFFLSLPIGEEQGEFLGITSLCLSGILCFISPLKGIVERNVKGSVLIFFSSGIMTVGNGFLHWQYHPGGKVYLVGLMMTIIGFLGVVSGSKIIFKGNRKSQFFSEHLFYLFIFFMFVVLPNVYGSSRFITAILLWLPSTLFAAFYMWRCHPANPSCART